MAGATARLRRPTRPGSRAAPLIRAVPHVDRAGRGGSAESGARRARAAATPMAALRRLCVHRSDVLGALSRAEVNSERRLRGLALEEVRGLGTNRAHGIERTARPAGAWAHTRADRHVIRASLAKRARRSQAAKGGEGRRGLRARAREGVKRARRVLLRAAGRLLAARGRAA